MTPLDFEPDSKWQYSNAGINTAGRIIEVVSGMPYEEFLDTRLFGPLGMKDTTFWPNPEQIARLAKSYRPTPDKANLEEQNVDQLKYPLDDHAAPADACRRIILDGRRSGEFCQMVLNGGEYQGKRYLSEAAIKAMTSKQTADLPNGYGFGWSTGGGVFGHGGAYATDMSIDSNRGLITIWLVQAAGGYPGNGNQAQGTFKHVADEQFAAAHK